MLWDQWSSSWVGTDGSFRWVGQNIVVMTGWTDPSEIWGWKGLVKMTIPQPHPPHQRLISLRKLISFLAIATSMIAVKHLVKCPFIMILGWLFGSAPITSDFHLLPRPCITSWFSRTLESRDFRRRPCRRRWSTSSPPPLWARRLGVDYEQVKQRALENKGKGKDNVRYKNKDRTNKKYKDKYWPTWVMRCLNSAVSTVPLPSLSRARNARVTWLSSCWFFLHGCCTAIGRPPKNHDPSNDNISHRFFIVGGVHLVAHHVTELRKLDLTRAIRVVLQGK